MSREVDELYIMEIRELSKICRKTQELITEKNKRIIEIQRTEKIRFKKPDPAPKPQGDIRITKYHYKTMRTPEQTKEETKKAEIFYANEIKASLKEKTKETEQEYLIEVIPQIDDLSLLALVETGMNAYRAKENEKQPKVKRESKFNFNDYLNTGYLDLGEKDEDKDKNRDVSDDFE
ncbi:hypothetical protein N1F78_00940 [Seonamhaeicola sp. MEBiC1930]|uniref:hypothetical protein n=1 Tax=Seonamhaeicola sp. MEBiC01930 TaxID=2976768 RepID=UPI003253E80E